jgi:hypothetical protein
MKRKHLAYGFADFVGGGKSDASALPHATPLQLQPQLQKKQLFKDQAPVRGRGRGLQLGERCAFRRIVHLA